MVTLFLVEQLKLRPQAQCFRQFDEKVVKAGCFRGKRQKQNTALNKKV